MQSAEGRQARGETNKGPGDKRATVRRGARQQGALSPGRWRPSKRPCCVAATRRGGRLPRCRRPDGGPEDKCSIRASRALLNCVRYDQGRRQSDERTTSRDCSGTVKQSPARPGLVGGAFAGDVDRVKPPFGGCVVAASVRGPQDERPGNRGTAAALTTTTAVGASAVAAGAVSRGACDAAKARVVVPRSTWAKVARSCLESARFPRWSGLDGDM